MEPPLRHRPFVPAAAGTRPHQRKRKDPGGASPCQTYSKDR